MDGIDDAQLKSVEHAISSVLDSSQAVLKVLDAVKDIHPAVGGQASIFLATVVWSIR